MVLRAIRREALTALINGADHRVVCGAGRAAVVPRSAAQPGHVGVSMSVDLLLGGPGRDSRAVNPAAASAPDPAVASSVFVLTSIDLTSFFVFLGLASLVLL